LKDEVLEGQASGPLGAGQRLTFGFEQRKELLANAGLPGGAAEADHQAVYAQLEAQLDPSFSLTAGLRGDEHERFGHQLSPRTYAVWRVAPQWVLKGGYGHGYKAPTLKQIDPNYREDEGPSTYLGRADLRAESNDTLELGLAWDSAQAGASLMGFRNHVQDLITPRLISGTPARGVYQFENLDNAVLQGLEASLAWRAGPWQLQANATWLSAKDERGQPLDKRARRSSGLRADYRAAQWSAGLAWERQSGLHLASSVAGQPPQAVPTLNLVNLHASWRFSHSLRLRAGVDNLSNLRLAGKSPLFSYEELPRTVRLALEARW
jgi:outer membrane receptor for ferrienterochelin and colicins